MQVEMQPRRGRSVRMENAFWKITNLADHEINLVQSESGERRQISEATWVSGVQHGVIEMLGSRRPDLGDRDSLHAGIFMRRAKAVWCVKVIRDGVLHLSNTETKETDRLTMQQWQEGCFRGEIDMMGTPSAELPQRIRDLISVPVTNLPTLMLDYVSWAQTFVDAWRNPDLFYREHLPDVAESERLRPRRLSKARLDPFLRVVADATGRDKPGASTFCKWLVKIDLAGGDIRAVAPRFDLRGPHHRYMAPRVEEWLMEAIDRVWLRRIKSKKKHVFDALGDAVGDWNQANPEYRLELPSEGHVNRYIRDTVDRYVAVARRKGKDAADLEFRQVGEGPVTTYFLERVEMDHTRSDLEILHDNGKVKLGRPWITVALDHYTRLPIGIAVHFLDQSVAAVFQALRNMMTPKGYMSRLVPEIDYTYPSGVPVTAFMDRGSDWDSDQVRNALGCFGMIPEYEPVGCPFYKGAIERWNRTLQEEVSHTVPGATPPWDIDGYVWDGEGKAYLTFSAYVRRVWRWVTMIYAKTWHRGIKGVPLDRWKESISRRLPRGLRKEDDLSILCNRVAECGVSNKGVEHEGLSWGGKYIEKIMANPAFRPGMKVKIRIDDEDVQNAWVINPFTAANEKLDPVLKTYMPGLNWYAHDMARKDSTVREKTARKESSMNASKKRQRLQAEGLLEGGKASGKAQNAAARYMGIGSRAPCGDSTGSVLPDPDAAVACKAGDTAVGTSAPFAAAIPVPIESAPAAPAPARMTRRVRNH